MFAVHMYVCIQLTLICIETGFDVFDSPPPSLHPCRTWDIYLSVRKKRYANVEENKKGCKKLSSEGVHFPLKCARGLKGAEPPHLYCKFTGI